MLKNLTLIETKSQNIKSWKLLDNSGSPINSFDIFSQALIKKQYSYNTRLSYSRSVALFIDYLEETHTLFPKTVITVSFLVDIIEAFPEWLLYGNNSGNDTAIKINKSYSSPQQDHNTVSLQLSAVRLFLNISDKVREAQESIGYNVDDKLFKSLNNKEIISNSPKAMLKKNNMLAGVISKGPQLIKCCVLPIKKSQTYFLSERAFPFDKIIPFIESFPSYRDKALYMFCAASGCRIHEALQVLIEDISIKDRSIKLIDPFSRITQDTYASLTPDQRDKLSWKGRQTDRTVLIQPFGDMFFEYLEQYLKKEYVPHNKHSFLFQKLKGCGRGNPYFLSSPSTRHEIFHNAMSKIGLDKSLNQGVHSLRHMYGTYLLNYFPKSDGNFGLPLAVVQKIMGHSNINSTQKYARHDKELFAVELEYANNLIYSNNAPATLLEFKKRALINQLIELERQANEI